MIWIIEKFSVLLLFVAGQCQVWNCIFVINKRKPVAIYGGMAILYIRWLNISYHFLRMADYCTASFLFQILDSRKLFLGTVALLLSLLHHMVYCTLTKSPNLPNLLWQVRKIWKCALVYYTLRPHLTNKDQLTVLTSTTRSFAGLYHRSTSLRSRKP